MLVGQVKFPAYLHEGQVIKKLLVSPASNKKALECCADQTLNTRVFAFQPRKQWQFSMQVSDFIKCEIQTLTQYRGLYRIHLFTHACLNRHALLTKQ